MTSLSDDVTPGADASSDARSAFESQTRALIAHLTKTAQVELGVSRDLRRRLAEAQARDVAHRQFVASLEVACARAENLSETRALMVRASEDKVKLLGTALTAAQRTCERQEIVIADLLASPSWRMTAAWRQLRRFWGRTVRHRTLRRKLAGHFHTPWFVREYRLVDVLEDDPFMSFMTHGLARGMNPNPCFDMRWYLRRYTDVASLGLHPLIHFQAHGFAEGRDPHPDVPCAAYRVRYETGWDA